MTATSQRAKFEYEMLQHYSGLEIAVLESQVAGVYVLFALPLLGDDSSWDPKSLAATGEPGDVYVPDGFSTPNFAVATDTLTIAMGYPLSDNDNDEAWPLVVEWPVGMKLSSQVTQIPSTSKGQSSIELITSCKKMFMQQWRYRKDFIGELRHHVIVLEYDPIDFSHVFFLLQEQLDAVSPLRILVLRLQFSAEFFLTNCTSDLQISLLDGEASTSAVSLELPATSIVANCEEAGDSQKSVVQFLEATRKSLLKHFYGE
ncbi:hypothetical protein PHYBOEH_012048 [Phytophthora boehmeriae]|uniref:Uncharacterized protein n=1 Tax=Phytophthora boehmeriae TaxID=109152 RepID=A0A8T1WVJ6_9STRA|nr:hypothetical protein PHYBOEH_012048 [Phytophthora boehmeriae]